MSDLRPLTNEEHATVLEYALAHGADWKDELNIDWMNARTTGILQALRNSHGPSWLADYSIADWPRALFSAETTSPTRPFRGLRHWLAVSSSSPMSKIRSRFVGRTFRTPWPSPSRRSACPRTSLKWQGPWHPIEGRPVPPPLKLPFPPQPRPNRAGFYIAGI